MEVHPHVLHVPVVARHLLEMSLGHVTWQPPYDQIQNVGAQTVQFRTVLTNCMTAAAQKRLCPSAACSVPMVMNGHGEDNFLFNVNSGVLRPD